MLSPQLACSVETRGLTKRFDRPAVDCLDLQVRAGEFYALLGPNGAGKTTTLRMVVGLLQPDSGSISILGIDALADPVAAKRVTAWLSDEPMIYDKLTPVEYLAFVAGLWGIDTGVAEGARTRAARLARPQATTRMSGAKDSPRACGRRWRSPARWCTTRALIILDEPLTGLDAASARQVKAVLRERVAAGDTVIMTTHILEVAERMADRIGIIAGGRLIAEGTLDELRGQAGHSGPRRWKTRSCRWSPNRPCRMSHPGTLAWFARHESRLAWRDWVAMMTAGRRRRMTTVVIALIAFVAFMHLLAYPIVSRFAAIGPIPTRRRWCS